MNRRGKVSELVAQAIVMQSLVRSRHSLSRGPGRLMLVLNKTCGSRCRYCQIWRQNTAGTLSAADYDRVARSVPQLTWLGLTGGEPMLREDLVDVVKAFVAACPALKMVNLTTNGLHEERALRVADELSATGLPIVYVNVSIDGPPVVHDRLRGVEGNFHRSLALLKKLRARKRIRAGVSYTLFPENLELLNETFGLIQRAIPHFSRAELSINLPQTSPHYYGTSALRLPDTSQLAQVLSRELEAIKFGQGGAQGLLKRAYLREGLAYLRHGRSPVPCSALRTNVYISESGEVFPCHTWERSLGNLGDFEFQLDRLLAAPVVTQARREIREQKCPGCWSPCQAYPSLLSRPTALLSHG